MEVSDEEVEDSEENEEDGEEDSHDEDGGTTGKDLEQEERCLRVS